MTDAGLTFVVGAEKGLAELLLESDVRPLLQGLLAAGAKGALVLDADARQLWALGDRVHPAAPVFCVPLRLEGEPVGSLQLSGDGDQLATLHAMARLAAVALETVLKNNLKRALTTEIHTSVVASSYEELVQSNARLAASEQRYRELAESLEIRVQERTEQLKKAHAHMLHQEKMAAIGQLAAGVAHEINNPMGFLTSNLHTLQKYAARLCTMVLFYRDQLKLEPSAAALAEAGDRKWRELKLAQVCADLGDLLSQSLAGAERVARIVANLKGFSHLDDAAEMPLDLNQELERSLALLSHQLDDVQVVRALKPLPPLCCPSQLPGHIFLNILQNAAATGVPDLRITLSSAFDGTAITVRIADNGPGVPPELRRRIFEPFFTTREVGSGTGMGLAVVYDAVQQLGGTVEVADAPGGGAEFVVRIPVAGV